jgi:hypothetical protein
MAGIREGAKKNIAQRGSPKVRALCQRYTPKDHRSRAKGPLHFIIQTPVIIFHHLNFCHSERSETPVFRFCILLFAIAFLFAPAFAFLVVIPEGNLLSYLPLASG